MIPIGANNLKPMSKTIVYGVDVQFGDCDPAGIVFYPRYFAMFDHSTVLLIERALGIPKHRLYETYDFAGYPSVATRARFLIPSSFGDDVVARFKADPSEPIAPP